MEHGEDSYRRFLEGDESAFTELVEVYRDPVTFFIQRYVHDLCTAEDIATDMFMQLVLHPKRYRLDTPLKAYLLMMARSRAIDWLRQQKRRPTVPLEDAEGWLADSQSLEETVLQNERARALHAALKTLPEEQQTAVHLIYFEQCSYADAAKIMKKTAKQVDNLLYRAKKALREQIGEEVAV